ncbi:hypothetical protein GCM10019059_44960 [Camelimonas fluminis]|uniref:Uncharacterized protein n=1 Tax=Camelimonas fluminis TaxID=1576911 RepID=A0ABV7UND5_9HYPH|nr:hypothetical protein [Camelimonas fluminis]GHE82587.1 hypothetical protein GCM10019059_44960 [Camelimonas fluminis]
MSMAWVRKYYGVPARRGGRVEYTGGWKDKAKSTLGTIRSASGGRLNIQLDGEKHASPFHPTYELRYLAAAAIRADQREIDAIACEVHAATLMGRNKGTPWSAAHECAAAIRAMGDKGNG